MHRIFYFAMDNLRVLELYSGIGGMHYALKGKRICGGYKDLLILILLVYPT